MVIKLLRIVMARMSSLEIWNGKSQGWPSHRKGQDESLNNS
jgi:hypothetical protein